MATIYDGHAIATGSKLPSGMWGWNDFGWRTSTPSTLAQFCPQEELAKARSNPAFAEWIGTLTGTDGKAQASKAAENAASSDSKMVEIYAKSGIMNHAGKISVGLCEDGE